jgi:uncharacterized radical SAM superfamily Fe-S cluster-containing enzyme
MPRRKDTPNVEIFSDSPIALSPAASADSAASAGTLEGIEVLHETRSLCPDCGATIPARYVALATGDAVFARSCPQHGAHDTDLGPHADFYRRIFALDREIRRRYGHTWEGKDYAPHDSPFPMRQRAGLGIIEVTERCNLTCPMCYAGSSPAGRDYTLEEIARRMDALLEVEGPGISIQISGGEPSVRKDLDQIARLAQERPFGHMEMVTNGIRLAREPDFAQKLVEWGFTSVYLQFDSLRGADLVKLRGEDLSDVRLKATEHVDRTKLSATLAVSLYDGLNDDQIGAIVEFCYQHPSIKAIAFQAATPFGSRWEVGGEGQRQEGQQTREPKKLRMPEILRLIEAQTGIATSNFFPLGIGSPLCNAYALLLHTPSGYAPIAPHFTAEDYFDVIGADPLDLVRSLTQGGAAVLPKITRNWRGTLKLVKALWPHIGSDPKFLLTHRTLTLFVKPFMDASDVDLERMERCCFHNSSPRGVMSFCALNNYRRDAVPTPESAFVPLRPRTARKDA